MRAEEILASAGQSPLLRLEDVQEGCNCESYAFKSNIQQYLSDNGNEIKLPGGSTCWSVQLGNGVSQLYIYEESVDEQTTVCDQCRIIGWGVHPVSSKKYHFIIPAETGPDSLDDPKSLVAITEACRSGKAHEDSISLPTKIVSETAEHHASIYNADPTIYDSTKHRLHGVIHGNGFGHLLRINGMYGGSHSVTGLQILALWDTLCVGLKARDITVEDVSSKTGMELRIAYFLAYGQTWYGLFGYDFGRGPYNITEKRWQDAGTFVSSILLSQLLHDFKGVEDRVTSIIHRYSLPVDGAAIVRDFGALLYRLLFLQLNPEQAKPFFNEKEIEHAEQHVMENGRKVFEGVKRKRAKKKGLKFSVAPKKKTAEVKKEEENQTANGKHNNETSLSKKLNSVKADPALLPSRVEDILLHSQVEVLLRGDLVSGEVVALPANRGRMHRIQILNGKVRKFDLHSTPWRFKGSLAPLSKMDDETLRMFEQKEEAKLESIKNSKNNSMNPAVLRYKAQLSRDDFVERARQLCRAIKSLIPKSRDIVGPAKTRIEMEAAFTALVGGAGPVVTTKNSWWEFLPKLLHWIQELLEISNVDAAKCVNLVDNTVEIDRQYLHNIGMFPESWEIPLRKDTIMKNNSEFLKQNPSFSFGEIPQQNCGVETRRQASNARKRALDALASSQSELESNEDLDEKIQMYVRESIDSTLDSIWQAVMSPDDDHQDTQVHRPWHDLEPGSNVDNTDDIQSLRNQITRDLHFLFMCTLKLYLPEVAKVAAQNASASLGVRYTQKLVKARQITDEVRILRDTKHFKKSYLSERDDLETNFGGKINVWTNLVMPAELNAQQMSSTRYGRKCLPIVPPAEIISFDQSLSIKDFLSEATARFQVLYSMCANFKAVGAWVADTQQTNAEKRASHVILDANRKLLPEGILLETLIGPKSKNSITLNVIGESYDLKPVWFHAGGPEDWVVNCPCGTKDDDGEAMVACDICETWMHTRCVNVPDGTHTWSCSTCQRRRQG